MKIKKIIITVSLVIASMNSHAGIYANDLSRCLVKSTTPADKVILVKWMFTAMSLHPAVKNMANVSELQRRKANKAMADLMVNLVTVSCLKESKKAIQYEGPVALQTSFSIFGKIAGRELFLNPEVAKGMSGLNAFIDKNKLKKLLDVK